MVIGPFWLRFQMLQKTLNVALAPRLVYNPLAIDTTDLHVLALFSPAISFDAEREDKEDRLNEK